MSFDWTMLSADDYLKAGQICNGYRKPDLIIAPDGLDPYLYRWHVIPRNKDCNVYFHIQVRSDPERPLHDHPWDNTSVILSGGYDELTNYGCIDDEPAWIRKLRKGDVQHRKAEEAHRLILPPEFKYTMTLFTTGPKRREWGFWFKDGWRDQRDVIENLPDGRSIFKGE